MQICVVEYTQNKSHAAVVKNIRNAVEEINKVQNFGLFSMIENLKK